MEDKLFNELTESIVEAGQILAGTREPSAVYNITAPDIKSIREKFGLSQFKFALLLGISTSTLQNWEQGRRTPNGPAKVLLSVAEKHPEALLDTVKSL